jgi:uncharacterized protein YfaS (alpha-2-macroglobulin family)
MVPSASGTSGGGEATIAIEPPIDVLSVAMETNAARYHPGDRARLTFSVRDASGSPRAATLLVGVVRLAAASPLTRQPPSIYDSINQAWGQQAFSYQSWWNLDATPVSSLVPPLPRKRTKTTPSNGVLVVGMASTPRSVRTQSQAASVEDDDTLLWRPHMVTDANGEASVDIVWPRRPDAYLVRLIATAADGEVGETSTMILVR